MKHTTGRLRTVGSHTNSPPPPGYSFAFEFFDSNAPGFLLKNGVRTEKCPAVEKQYLFTGKFSQHDSPLCLGHFTRAWHTPFDNF